MDPSRAEIPSACFEGQGVDQDTQACRAWFRGKSRMERIRSSWVGVHSQVESGIQVVTDTPFELDGLDTQAGIGIGGIEHNQVDSKV
jgi:hypothetical protein